MFDAWIFGKKSYRVASIPEPSLAYIQAIDMRGAPLRVKKVTDAHKDRYAEAVDAGRSGTGSVVWSLAFIHRSLSDTGQNEKLLHLLYAAAIPARHRRMEPTVSVACRIQ